jgi:hypothetical protein
VTLAAQPSASTGACQPASCNPSCGSDDVMGDLQDAGLTPSYLKAEYPPSPLTEGFNNVLNLYIDELREEPKRILIIGGCRQRALARKLALIFINSQITVTDPDPEEARLADEEVNCRLKFIHAPCEALPFADNAFDVTFAHHWFDLVTHFPKAASEASRVTQTTFWCSHLNGAGQKFPGLFPGLHAHLAADRLTHNPQAMANTPDKNVLLRQMLLYAKLQKNMHPGLVELFPWATWLFALKPDRQERLVLS